MTGSHGLDFDAARAGVARHARATPLLRAAELSEEAGRDVLLKLECLQHTGSFKVRGAAARLEAIPVAPFPPDRRPLMWLIFWMTMMN